MAMEMIKKYKRAILATALILVISLLVFDILFGRMGLFEYRREKARYENQETQKQSLDGEIEMMKKEVEDLRNNLDYIEEIARKDLGLLKDAERIIILKDDEGISEEAQGSE